MIYFLKLFFFDAIAADTTTKKKKSFKDRGTVARAKHNIKTFTGCMKLKLSSFRPSMDKNRKANNYRLMYAKIGETKKKKNGVLIRER